MNWYSDYKTEWKEIIETVSLVKMFNLIDIGERAGIGIPKIVAVYGVQRSTFRFRTVEFRL